jgi:hypothetical protein
MRTFLRLKAIGLLSLVLVGAGLAALPAGVAAKSGDVIRTGAVPVQATGS